MNAPTSRRLVATGLFLFMALGACGRITRRESTVSAADAAPKAFELRFSKRVLEPAVQRTVHETTPFEDWMNGAYIYGQAEHDGVSSLDLRVSDTRAMIDTIYTGTTVTSASGQSHPAVFWTTARTDSGTRKKLSMSVDEISSLPAASNATTNTWIDGVDVDVRLFYRIALNRAWNQIESSIPYANATVNARTVAEINARIDDEHASLLEKSGLRALQTSAQRLRAAAGLEDRVHFASTTESVSLVAETMQDAPKTAPAWGDGDVLLRFDQAFLEETGTRIFGGQSMTEAEIRAQIDHVFGPLFGEVGAATAAPSDGMSMRFPVQRPLTIVLGGGKVTITIRGERFQTPNNTYELPMDIQAVYALAPEGGVKLLRQGDISVLPPNFDPATGQMSFKQQVLAGELRARMVSVLVPELAKAELTLPIGTGGKLAGDRIEVKDGWLLAVWKLLPAN